MQLHRCPQPIVGRGIRLIEHYMDEVNYYSGGRTLVMAKSL
jgi:anti-sigma regulatory factor (Ser/Thr protein kinase)